jgi:hypothetical protein
MLKKKREEEANKKGGALATKLQGQRRQTRTDTLKEISQGTREARDADVAREVQHYH